MKTVKIFKTTMEICNVYEAFRDFEGMLIRYFMKNHNANATVYNVALRITKMNRTKQTFFIMYILEYWNEYAMDIINGEYNLINLTETVFDSWIKHEYL